MLTKTQQKIIKEGVQLGLEKQERALAYFS